MDTCDKATAAQSTNRDVSNAAPAAKQSCSDVVNISIFFDGTGNNRLADGDLVPAGGANPRKWSNPARMWRAAQLLTNDDAPNYAIYIPGVGTPYGGKQLGWADEKMTALQDSALGMGFGTGGTRRTDLGHVEVNAQLRSALSQSAAKLNLSLAPYVEGGKPANIKELAKALEGHGLITIINLSIFGFSRGAALARAFSNEIYNKTSVGTDGVRRYNGVPIRFNFMGLFDTVASFGWPALNIDTPFNEKNLVVPPVVEHCVHYVAGQELRFAFPVDLIRKGGKLQPGWTETVYPGAHSDVGGGYEPVTQEISNNYARIPMRDMMREAVKCGVRISDYDEIEKNRSTIFEERFAIQPDTLAAYRKYMAEIGTHGTVEDAVTAHMKALYSTWGTMTRRKIKTPDLIQAESREGTFGSVGHPGIAHEAKMHLAGEEFDQALRKKVSFDIRPIARTVQGKRYSIFVQPAKWRMDAWQTTASDPIVEFIRQSVHDSKAGFIHACEPSSYFAPRGMTESSRNVLAQGLDWLADSVTAVKNGVVKVYHRAEGVIAETWEAGKLVATRTYRVGEKFVVDTVRAGVRYTVEVYQGSKEVVISTVKMGQQMVITSVDSARRQAKAAADATQRKAGEVADAAQKKVGEIADATQRKATEMADAAQRKAGEIINATQRKASEVGSQIYSGASDAAKDVGQAVDSGVKAVEDSWASFRSTVGI